MGAPITWRNVDVNPIGEISRAMMSSQTGINAGFDNFQKILERQQATDTANWNQEKTNKTNAYLNEVGSFKTPEEYQAALDSGRLHQMLTDGGAQIDQAAARQALGAQMGILQERMTKGQQFQDNQTDRAEAPIKDQIASLTAQGKFTEAKALLDQHTLRNEAALYKGTAESERKDVLEKRADASFNRQEELAKLTHPEAVQAAKDVVESRNLTALTTAAHQAYAAEMGKRGMEMGKIAQSMGLPVNSSGAPKLSSFDKTQEAAFYKEAAKLGIADPANYLKGDTKKADQFYDGLVASGQYSATTLAKLKDSIRAGFDSTGTGSVGIEAENRKVANAREAAYIDNLSKDTWSTPGSPTALQNQPALTDLVNKNVDKDYQTLAHRAISKVLTEGIKLKDGKTITPSRSEIEAAINSTNDDLLSPQGWSIRGGDFGDKLIRNLQERANSGNAETQRTNMERVNEYNLRKSASEYYSKGAPSNPLNR